jgi:hypothetical protein
MAAEIISSIETAGPRNMVRHPASSAKRRKLLTPATCTHSPRAPAMIVFNQSPYKDRSLSIRYNNDELIKL